MDSNSSSSKRSNESAASERQHRQKREKYTSVACNECKKRKIKCSGDNVCQRCDTLGLRCIYASNSSDNSSTNETSTRLKYVEAKIDAMEKQLGQLYAVINTNPAQYHMSLPLLHASGPGGLQGSTIARGYEPEVCYLRRPAKPVTNPSFIGPTSSLYSLDIGNSSLKSMGVQPDSEHGPDEPNSMINTPRYSPAPQRREISLLHDTLMRIGKEEAIRLISIYSDELSPIYPFLDVSQAINHLNLLLTYLNAPAPIFGPRPELNQPGFDSRDSDILMMVLASALTIEGLGQSTLAEQLADTVEAARSRRSRTTPADIKEVLIMSLMSVYHFHCDEDILAWRKIGSAARAALEMGLHRKDSLFKTFRDSQQRSWATKLFWCVYVLDRRWALGTGMPCALSQSDIDTDLPEPDGCPYLQRLIVYARISSKVLKAVNDAETISAKARKDESDYLDFQVQQWLQGIPPDLQLLHPNLDDGSGSQPRSLHRSRVLLYVRANHMRILIHRHNLLSATSIADNVPDAKSVVETAKDTIQVLAHLNRTSNLYHTQQACFNYFLVTALAALFLAVCHGPTHFSESCRSEFYMALDLVKGFSSKSLISRRLWKTIRDLKSLGPKLGVTPTAANDEGSSAAAVDQSNTNVCATDAQIQNKMLNTNGCTTDAQIQNNLWNGDALWPEQTNDSWMTSHSVPDIGNQITYALTDLYEFAEGNASGAAGMADTILDNESHDQHDNFYPLEHNAAVSRLLEPLF